MLGRHNSDDDEGRGLTGECNENGLQCAQTSDTFRSVTGDDEVVTCSRTKITGDRASSVRSDVLTRNAVVLVMRQLLSNAYRKTLGLARKSKKKFAWDRFSLVQQIILMAGAITLLLFVASVVYLAVDVMFGDTATMIETRRIGYQKQHELCQDIPDSMHIDDVLHSGCMLSHEVVHTPVWRERLSIYVSNVRDMIFKVPLVAFFASLNWAFATIWISAVLCMVVMLFTRNAHAEKEEMEAAFANNMILRETANRNIEEEEQDRGQECTESARPRERVERVLLSPSSFSRESREILAQGLPQFSGLGSGGMMLNHRRVTAL